MPVPVSLRPGEVAIDWAEAKRTLREKMGFKTVTHASHNDNERLLAADVLGHGQECMFVADAITRIPVLYPVSVDKGRARAEKARTEEEFAAAASDRRPYARHGLYLNKKTPRRFIDQVLAEFPDDDLFRESTEHYSGLGYYVE